MISWRRLTSDQAECKVVFVVEKQKPKIQNAPPTMNSAVSEPNDKTKARVEESLESSNAPKNKKRPIPWNFEDEQTLACAYVQRISFHHIRLNLLPNRLDSSLRTKIQGLKAELIVDAPMAAGVHGMRYCSDLHRALWELKTAHSRWAVLADSA
jgi:hypothetical protein